MPPDAEKTHQAILASAKTDFLRHGFAGASLRRIAADAGLTTGALYRHFRDKDALFEAVVAPAYLGFFELYHAHNQRNLNALPAEGMEPMWNGTEDSILFFMDYVYANFDAFKLLISCSEHSAYEKFIHTLVEEEIEATLHYMQTAEQLGMPVRAVRRESLHFLVSAQISNVLELVLHDTPQEVALCVMKETVRFFEAGWRAFLLP